jgi:hypothetical protein
MARASAVVERIRFARALVVMLVASCGGSSTSPKSSSASDFYITGAYGLIGRWNGRIWSHALDGTDMPLRSVSGAGGEVWAVGTWAALLHR